MHATEREQLILQVLSQSGFASFKALEKHLDASPATIRRDLERLDSNGLLIRVRGGAKQVQGADRHDTLMNLHLRGPAFDDNMSTNLAQKKAIGKVASSLCSEGEGIMMDGGSTTFQMCPYLDGLRLQVLTNSLHIVLALINQKDTRVLVPGGAIFPEQNIILSAFGEDCMPRFFAPKLFMGAGSIGPQGLMQEDVVLVAGERRFVERAEEVIVLVDSTKFTQSTGNVVCSLGEIDSVITDERLTDEAATFLECAGVKTIIAKTET